MKLYICQYCFGVCACFDEKEFKKCSDCSDYIYGKIPCHIYIEATQVVKDYECDLCREEHLAEQN